MSTIEELRQRIDSVSQMIYGHEDTPTEKSIAHELSTVSLRHHLEDLQSQLSAAMALRGKEIIEIALDTGEPGTISLRLLAKIANNFGQAVNQTGRFLRHGTVRGPVPTDIERSMDLRLADLTAASTHLFITGTTAPDLFGNSLVEESLRHTFDVLRADSAEELTDAVATIGYSAASALRRLLKEVSRDDRSLMIRWRTPEEHEEFWEAGPETMRSLAASLEAFSRTEPQEIDVDGTVITVSLREPFAIEGDNGQVYSAVVSIGAMPLIQEITVGVRARATLLRNVMINRTTGREKITFTLLRLVTL